MVHGTSKNRRTAMGSISSHDRVKQKDRFRRYRSFIGTHQVKYHGHSHSGPWLLARSQRNDRWRIPPAVVSGETRVEPEPVTLEHTACATATEVLCYPRGGGGCIRGRARHSPGAPRLPPIWVCGFCEADNVGSTQ